MCQEWQPLFLAVLRTGEEEYWCALAVLVASDQPGCASPPNACWFCISKPRIPWLLRAELLATHGGRGPLMRGKPLILRCGDVAFMIWGSRQADLPDCETLALEAAEGLQRGRECWWGHFPIQMPGPKARSASEVIWLVCSLRWSTVPLPGMSPQHRRSRADAVIGRRIWCLTPPYGLGSLDVTRRILVDSFLRARRRGETAARGYWL